MYRTELTVLNLRNTEKKVMILRNKSRIWEKSKDSEKKSGFSYLRHLRWIEAVKLSFKIRKIDAVILFLTKCKTCKVSSKFTTHKWLLLRDFVQRQLYSKRRMNKQFLSCWLRIKIKLKIQVRSLNVCFTRTSMYKGDLSNMPKSCSESVFSLYFA